MKNCFSRWWTLFWLATRSDAVLSVDNIPWSFRKSHQFWIGPDCHGLETWFSNSRWNLCQVGKIVVSSFGTNKWFSNIVFYFRNCVEWGIFEQAMYTFSMVLVPIYDHLNEDCKKFIMRESEYCFLYIVQLERKAKVRVYKIRGKISAWDDSKAIILSHVGWKKWPDF